ncbi:ribonucleotide-diphosphate reductase subunit alpha, partial [Candidatus Woesebacteria bacterium CG_4_9_14_3_um_filter_39_10]
MPKIPKDLKKGVWTEQAVKVLEERYLKKDNNGKTIETPEEMCWRVSWEVASAEARWGKTKKEILETAKDYYNLLVKHEFLPNSPTLMNAGTGNNLQYSACFVIPVEDSIEGIFDALKYQALIHKTGGGTGFSFSRLRPHGSMVKTSSGTASGPVSFMRIFDAATNEVKQGGKRRGANMGILRVDHPDILEFIHCKEEGGITNFNISVGITDKFIEAYKEGKDYELINPKTKEVSGKLSAKLVFDEIVKSAWKTGDPGVIFIDRMNEGTSNPVPLLGPIESTNPCGEVPLYPFDSCNLG